MFIESYALRATTPVERTLAGLGAAILLLPVDRMIDYFFSMNHKLFYESYAVGGALAVIALLMQLKKRTAEPALQQAARVAAAHRERD